MDCKRDCNWNYDGICCSDELDDRYDEATGDDSCPLWLRPNFDEYFHDTYDYIRESIKHMNISKLEQVKYAIDQINNGNNFSKDLIEWLKGEKYIIRCEQDKMSEEFEKEHTWELSRNRMIDKTINKINEDLKEYF